MNRMAVTPAASPQPPKPVEIPHQIGVRVTTLLKPSIYATPPLAFEDLPKGLTFSGDSVPRIINNSAENASKALDTSRSNVFNYSGVGDMLQFTTGADFYLSDSFGFYLHFFNDSDQVLTGISTSVTVKDPLAVTKTVLDTTTTPMPELKQQQSKDEILSFPITEAGYHVLGLQITYITQAKEQRTLSKHFRFMVNKPLSVEATLVSNIPNGNLVRVDVSNLTSSNTIFIENLEFVSSSSALVVHSLNPLVNQRSELVSGLGEGMKSPNQDLAESLISFPNTMFIRAGCSAQFLFSVAYSNPESIDPKSISSLGNAILNWRLSMGEPSTSTSLPVAVNNATKRPFTLIVSHLPSSVKVMQAFTVTFTLKNQSTTVIRPRFFAVKSKMQSLYVSGLCGQLAPKIAPGDSYNFNVKLIALEAGVQVLHGIRITELERDKAYDMNSVLTVLAEL